MSANETNGYFDLLWGLDPDSRVSYERVRLGDKDALSSLDSEELRQVAELLVSELGYKDDLIARLRRHLFRSAAGLAGLRSRPDKPMGDTRYMSSAVPWMPTAYAWLELDGRRLGELLVQYGWTYSAIGPRGWESPDGSATFGVYTLLGDTPRPALLGEDMGAVAGGGACSPVCHVLQVDETVYRDTKSMCADFVESTPLVLQDTCWCDSEYALFVAFGSSLRTVLVSAHSFAERHVLRMWNAEAVRSGLLNLSFADSVLGEFDFGDTPEGAFRLLCDFETS